MGRELKRVSLKFEWPLNKVWVGYLNPHYEGHYEECPDCNGTGSTTAMQRLNDLVSLLMISGEDSIDQKCHSYFQNMHGLYYTQGITPSKDMVELTSGLAGRKPCCVGHDCGDRWRAAKKIIAAAGLKKSWGICQHCKGEGHLWDTAENKRRAGYWRKKEPPKGKGYQIWETVSEGSPVSPVFTTPEELADWMVANDTTATTGTTREQWLKFINGPGWAPSFASSQSGFVCGVQAV